MKASIVDLRYHMKDVLKALDRNEQVTIVYRGKEKGTIVPCKSEQKRVKVQDTPLFGMYKDDERAVNDIMTKLRGGRYRDL